MASGLNLILDVGSSKLRLCAYSVVNKEPYIITEEDALYDGYMDGEFLSKDKLVPTIESLFDKIRSILGNNINRLTIGVPCEFTRCVCKRVSRRFIANKKLNESDLRELFESNMTFADSEKFEVINFSPMRYVLDDNMITLRPVGQRTHSIVADVSYLLASKSFIATLSECIKSQQIKNVDFVSSVLGQADMCRRINHEGMDTFAVVDVGHIATSVCVYRGEGIAMLSSFDMGGGHISADLMQVLSQNFKNAELIKRKVILTISSNRNDNYLVANQGTIIKAPISITNQVVKSRIEMLAKAVNNVLEISEQFKNIKIYITGDGIANFKGAKNILSEITSRPVVEFKNQFDNSAEKYQTAKTGLMYLANELE